MGRIFKGGSNGEQLLRTEHALREREAQLELILDSTAEAIYGVDLEGHCTFCNRACLEVLGYTRPEDLLGKNMHDLIHYKHPDGSPYAFEECGIYQATWRGEASHADDDILWKRMEHHCP